MTIADDTRARAAHPEHEWDRKAIDWPLTSDSVVVEVGGYTGRWALQIQERYNPQIVVFEPQFWAFEVCREILSSRTIVLPYGLGIEDGYFPMGKYGTDGCTFVSGGDGQGRMCDIGRVFAEIGITHIDLMLMNIEGYEYTLIPHMLDRGILPDRLMVQFHPQPNDERTMAIYDLLETHGYTVVWTYGDVLSAWERVA